MRTNRVWKKWLPVTLFIALASFGTMGFAFAGHGNPSPAITADHALCHLDIEGVSPDVLAEFCSAWGYARALEDHARSEGGDISPSVSYGQDSWQYARAFEDHAMSEGGDVSPSVSYDSGSWEYARALEDYAISERW